MSWSGVFQVNPVLRVAVIAGSFMWGLFLIIPLLLSGAAYNVNMMVYPSEVGFICWVCAVIKSSLFWAVLFLVHGCFGLSCMLTGGIRRCTVLIEGVLGLFIWGMAIVVYLVNFLPWMLEAHHLMQPFTPVAVLSGNIVMFGLHYVNVVALWAALPRG